MIIGATWIFPVSSPPLKDHAIEIESGEIKRIRPALAGEPFLKNHCLVPGLVNAHAHLAYTAMRNVLDRLPFFPWLRRLTEIKYEKLTEEYIHASAMLGISECVKAGITTVADLSDCPAALKALAESPLRGIFYWEVFGVEKQQAKESWNNWQVLYPSLCDRYASSRLQVGLSPHAPFTIRPEFYSQIADWAGNSKVPVSFHAAESREEEDFIRERRGLIADTLKSRTADWVITERTSISHLASTGILDVRPLLAHVVQASPEDVALLAARDVSVAHCPKSNAKFGHGIAPITEMLARAMRVGIGSDSAASNNRLDLFEEGRFALLQQRSRYQQNIFSEEQVLEMLTLGGARALGLDQEIGSLEAGKRADVIALSLPEYYASAQQVLHHLIHNMTAANVTKTIIDGNEVSVDAPTEEIAALYKLLAADEAGESL